MKFSSTKILTLCAFHSSVWGATAFVIQPPPQVSTTALHSFQAPQTGQFSVSSEGPAMGGLSNTSGGAMQTRGTRGMRSGDSRLEKNIWDTVTPIKVQGGSLKTWSFQTEAIQRVQVLMKTEGRPLNANVDLWQGPDNTPQKMGIYIEDGAKRPFCCVIETPRSQNAIAIRNTGQMEFPLEACVEADIQDSNGNGLQSVVMALEDMTMPEIIQGGALKTYSFAPSVASVQILLRTDGRPLNARIELLQGPNNNKQVVELYIEDGMERPFFMVIETPGTGNVVRIVNTAPVEFPLNARVEPYLVEAETGSPFIVSDGQ